MVDVGDDQRWNNGYICSRDQRSKEDSVMEYIFLAVIQYGMISMLSVELDELSKELSEGTSMESSMESSMELLNGAWSMKASEK